MKKFNNGVKAVKEFTDQFGDEIMGRLKRSFQLFKDISTIFAEVISRIFEFISNNKILAKVFGELDQCWTIGFADRLHEIAEGIREDNAETKKQMRSREKMIERFTKAKKVITENLVDATEISQMQLKIKLMLLKIKLKK